MIVIIVTIADLEGGDGGQLVAAQQLLQAHADALLGCIHFQNTAGDLLPLLVLAGASFAVHICHVHGWDKRPAQVCRRRQRILTQ